MSDDPASMQLVLPKSAVELVDRLRDKNAVFNAENTHFDRDKAISDAMFIGKALVERRKAEDDQQANEPGQGSQGIQPIPNVPNSSAPDFGLLPVRPGDKPPEFLPIPNIVDTPSAVPPVAMPLEGQESSSPINADGQTQDSTQSTIQRFIDGLTRSSQGSELETGSPNSGTPDIDQDDSRYEAASDLFMRHYPNYGTPWSGDNQDSRRERSSNSAEHSKNSEEGSEPNNRFQDILPTVKSGCEAMIKLAEIGGDIRKQLAQLIEQKGGRVDIQYLDKEPSRNKPELEGIYQNPTYDAFAQAYEAFRNQPSDTSLEPRALRRNP